VVLGRLFLVPLTTKFLRKHPHVSLELVFGDRYVSLVEEGFDLSVRVGVPVDSTLRAHPLADGRRRVVASPGYLSAHGTPGKPRELEDHECLVHTQLGSRASWTFEKAGKTQRVAVRGRASANNSEATLAMARSGLGICMLASWLVDPDVRSGRLVPILEDYSLPPAPIRALTPPGRHLAPHVRALIDHLREGLAEKLG
jgi:DNA-binding transcriptional LysR family regulator